MKIKIILSICFLITLLTHDAYAVSESVLPPDTNRLAHVCFVNVTTNISMVKFDQAVSNACATSRIRSISVKYSKMTPEMFFMPTRKHNAVFSSKTLLVIYLVDSEDFPSFATIPYCTALVNSRTFKGVDGKLTDIRLVKLLMKGLALAGGVSSTMEPPCVVYRGSFSPETIDATSATFGPNAFYPLLEFLMSRSSEEILLPL